MGALEGVAPAGAGLPAERQAKIAPNGIDQQAGSSVCKDGLLGLNGRLVTGAEMTPLIGSSARVEADPEPLPRYDIALGIAAGSLSPGAAAVRPANWPAPSHPRWQGTGAGLRFGS